jgi:DNA-binding HxlR family transcriptional regulator
MYDYGEACPISMAASVLCERWTLQIIREMFLGSTKYSEIQKFIPNISPSLLRDRLRSLESQGLVMRKCAERGNRYEYFLTPSRKALAPVLTEMGKWGMRHARDGMTDKANTASGLARDFAGRLDVDELPSGNTSVQLNLTDVEESPRHYIHVRNGEVDMTEAVESRRMKVVAAPVYCRRITRWLRISSFTTDNPSFAGT